MLRYNSIVVIATAMALLFTPALTATSPPADPATASWSCGPAGSLDEARSDHTATLLPDGRVLIVGGGRRRGKLASAETWDPASGEFSPTGSLAEGREWHTATLLPDGRVLVVGGSGEVTDGMDNFLTSAEIWDPATGEFSPTGSMTDSRIHHTATLLQDGRVLVVAGIVLSIAPLVSAELWDPGTGEWTPTGSLEQWRAKHTATLLDDGRVLVIGGGSFTRDGFKTFRRAEAWDPASGAFGPAGRLDTSRMGHSATRLHDGRVLVVGGTKMRAGKKQTRRAALDSAEVWDPVSGSFEPVATLTQLSGGTRAGLLPDAHVFVVGDISDADPEIGMPPAVAEIWDPESASFSLAGSLSGLRGGQTVTILPDGRALVVGGFGEAGRHPASAEICQPESTLALQGAPPSEATAQDAADPMAPAYFTFRLEPVGEAPMSQEAGLAAFPDWEMQMVRASDPRASGLMTISVDSNLVEVGEGVVLTKAMSERLTNDDGAWSGTGRFVFLDAEDGPLLAAMDVLTGEGGYEGLTLIMGQFEDARTETYWGVIVPSDQVPPIPGPLEPPAE